jgi:hypothetical protein
MENSMETLTLWLKKQNKRADLVGQFARQVSRDYLWNVARPQTWFEVDDYVLERGDKTLLAPAMVAYREYFHRWRAESLGTPYIIYSFAVRMRVEFENLFCGARILAARCGVPVSWLMRGYGAK